jgi:hypothetical protein
MTARTTIHAGVCGFRTTVVGQSDDVQNVALSISSDCEKIRRLSADLPSIDAYQEIGAGFDGVVLQAARRSLSGCCAGCVVPSGIFKTVQVAGGVALPAEVSIGMEKVEEAPAGRQVD